MIANKKKKEVLRYLGYKNQKIDQITHQLIDRGRSEIELVSQEKYIYKTFKISRHNGRLELDGTDFHLPGDNIKKYLSKSEECILMGATLGHEVDKKIRYYEKTSMTKALILDAWASVYVEDLCDRICEEISKNLTNEAMGLSPRFSPGYGDLPIDIQDRFLSILDAKRQIGLTSTSSSILIPRKSVTAIMAIIPKDEVKKENRCINCNKYGSCAFSEEEISCGN